VKRRTFITLLGGAAAWPLAARAAGNQVRSIGVLLAATADASEYQARLGAFQQELQKFGWSIGRNLRIHIRWAGINADAKPDHHAVMKFSATATDARAKAHDRVAVNAGDPLS